MFLLSENKSVFLKTQHKELQSVLLEEQSVLKVTFKKEKFLRICLNDGLSEALSLKHVSSICSNSVGSSGGRGSIRPL